MLETGRVPVQDGGIEWVGLKLVADDPRQKKSESKTRDWVAVLAVGACIAFAFFIFIVGLGTLWS